MGNEVQTILKALSASLIPKLALGIFSGALLFTILIAVIQNAYTWTDAKPPRQVASLDVWKLGMVTGTAGTATAFLVTLFVAERNYRRSREHIPNLSMTLLVSRVPVSLTYDAIIVTLNATNTGTGLCRVKQIDWDLKVLSPYDDDIVDDMQTEFLRQPSDQQEVIPDDDDAIEFPWHRIRSATTAFDLNIEPNETEQTTQDFIILAEITAVVASAWVANASEPKLTDGWYRRAPHYREELDNARIQ